MGTGTNAGIFFHTENPGPKKKVEKGYECQICDDGFKDPRKTGSLYDVQDLKESAAKPEEWATYVIRVEGKRITLIVNGKTTVDYTEPDDAIEQNGFIALQIHAGNPTEAWYKEIVIEELP